MQLSKEKRDIVNNFINDLSIVDNVMAIVLGGSYATGDATDSSDLDIAIYYFENKPFDIEAIKSIARKYSIDNRPTVTGFYEWGPWVNGGAWIKTACGKVDFLYKNIDQVKSVIEKAKNGEWENHYEQQPPYGFSSIIYLAETHYCIPLYDPHKIIERLKAEVVVYPQKLKEVVIQHSLWSAEFTIVHAEYFSKRHDLYNTVGCLARAVKNIVTTLFALNELYLMGDKRAIEILEKVKKRPANLREVVEKVLCIDRNLIDINIALLRALFDETKELAACAYTPFYNLE